MSVMDAQICHIVGFCFHDAAQSGIRMTHRSYILCQGFSILFLEIIEPFIKNAVIYFSNDMMFPCQSIYFTLTSFLVSSNTRNRK